MMALVVVMLILGSGAHAAPRKAQSSVSKLFEIEGKRVTEDEYRAKTRTLEGSVDYHCKKTTFGGVVSYKARDRGGHWFYVRKVSGGTQPSTIERTEKPDPPDAGDAPEHAAKRKKPAAPPKHYRVYKGDQPVMDIVDSPGVLVSSSAPPPPPGFEPPTNPFLSATAYAPLEEGKLRALLDASHDTDEYLSKLRHAGYRVEESTAGARP